MKLLNLLFILFFSVNTFGAFTEQERSEFVTKNILKEKNPGFESGTANWTASGGTFTYVDSSSTNMLTGNDSGTWNSTSGSQTLTSAAVTIPKGLYGRNGLVMCKILTPSGAATHTIAAYDGSSTLASATVVSSTTPTYTMVNFQFPATGTIAIRLTSVNADEPLISIDDCYIGDAINLSTGTIVTNWVAYTPTGAWVSGNEAYTGKWRRVGDEMEVRVNIALIGAPTSASLTINLPTGYTIDATNKIPGSAGGGNTALGQGSFNDAGTTNYPLWVVYSSTTAVSVRGIKTDGTYADQGTSTSQSVPFTSGNTDSLGIWFKVPILGWSANSDVISIDNSAWYVDATITGANPTLGVIAVTGYTEIADGGLTMTVTSGSAPAAVMCSTTNPATAPTLSTSTCGVGNESLGANFNIPVAGTYEVCAYTGWQAQVDTAEGVQATFELIETSLTNASTINLEGGSRQQVGHTAETIATGADAIDSAMVTTCGMFNWTSSGNKGVRLMYEQAVAGSPDTSVILMDAGANNGQRNFHITVKPITRQLPMTQFTGSVVSASDSKVKKMATARLNCDSGSSIIYQDTATTNWVTSIANVASGVCTMVINGFTAAPVCTLTNETGASNDPQVIGFTTAPTTTALSVDCADNAGTDCTAYDFELICVGDK